tara:strand:- start:18627 stop:19301 length:675 start_codon:yes stop_codon:yes gene_type:complete
VAKPLITADVLIPDLVFEVTNEQSTVRAMASVIARAVKKNTIAGKDAFGRKMPAPKDKGSKQNPDGKALKRTGRLIAEILAHEKKRRRRKASKSGKKSPIAYGVKSAGKRPKKENVAAKKKRAREKTKQARAAAVLGQAFGQLSTGQSKKKVRLSRIRFRTADTNAALAGILSAPPKDRRSKAGNRAQYRVFVASPEYQALGSQQANKTIRYKMGEKRKIRVKK